MYQPETRHGTDTWRQTLDDAFAQAEWEFGIARKEWNKTDRPYSWSFAYRALTGHTRNFRVLSGLTVIVPLSDFPFRAVILTRSGRICGCF